MRCLLLPLSPVLAACTPSPQEVPMPNSGPDHQSIGQPTAEQAKDQGPIVPSTATPSMTERSIEGDGQAVTRPEPLAVIKNAPPASPSDSPAAALGRRTLSTAFVRTGPDGHVTIELRDGRVLVLRDVVMQAKNYCGAHVLGTQPGRQFCGEYVDVAAARPGGSSELTKPSPAEGPSAMGHESSERR